MTDMDAFDRLVAREVVRATAPSRPVNDAAIFTDITGTQSPKWRLGSMFSATKFVVPGAIVALVGGLLLVAQPFDQQEASVPGAATDVDAAAPVEFTATVEYGDGAGAEESLFPVIASDPRFEGTLSWTATRETFPGADIELEAVSVRIENDDGSWERPGWLHLVNLPDDSESSGSESGGPEPYAVTYVGTGGYEGLFIVAEETFSAMTLEADLHGYIFEGEPPGALEPWSGDPPPDD